MARTKAGKSPDLLETYREKRRFDITPEPAGRRRAGRRKAAGELRYLIQKHDATRLHYDFRLELDGVLKSWAVTRGPSLDPSQKRLAVRTEDHPIEYGDFEGIIPRGQYGGGSVMLWDTGHWEPVDDPRKGLEKGKLSFILHGQRLQGRFALVRMRPNPKEKRENWLLIKDGDDHADPGRDVTGEYDTSVATGRSMEEIAAAPASRVWNSNKDANDNTKRKKPSARCPGFVPPQLATLVDETPTGRDWIFEIKFDGYRALLSACGEEVAFYSRNGHDWTGRLPGLAAAARRLRLDRMLVDGEVVAVDDEGRTSFSALQQALKNGGRNLAFFAFDLLVDRGEDIRKLSNLERKERLARALGKAGRTGPIYYTDHLVMSGDAMLDELCSRRFEGVIAKKASAPYRSGRVKSWLKVKCDREQEFVVIGISPSERNRPFSSLLLGFHDSAGKLRYAGRVGSGFARRDLAEIDRRLKPLRRKSSPLDDKPAGIPKAVRWVEPKLVVQVAFAEFTHDGAVRHARFLGIREDKAASRVTKEDPRPLKEVTEMAAPKTKRSSRGAKNGTAVVAGVKLSNPDKILFPEQGITKLELAEYLEAAAPHMLPHLKRRLVSFVRCPEGRTKECFFQRHAGPGLMEAVKRMVIPGNNTGTEEYLYIEDVKGLVATAQIGVLELHIWGIHVDMVEKPDRIVFDLDPAEGLAFSAVTSAALHVRDLLDALGLVSFPLLTGGKGVHVVAPIARRHEWPVVKKFTAALAQRMAESDPDRFIANMSKARRKGRIFVDYLRNERGSTAICPFSPRARPGAPVAWPVSWDNLEGFDSAAAVSLQAAPGRFQEAAKAWKGYFDLRQSLTRAALNALDVA